MLLFLHFTPIYKTVEVVEQECDKAYNHRNVPCIGEACKYPQNYQDHVVGGVGKGKERTSAEGQNVHSRYEKCE